MKLYEHPLSPYAQKVKIALYEKSVPFEAGPPTSSAPIRSSKPRARAARCRAWSTAASTSSIRRSSSSTSRTAGRSRRCCRGAGRARPRAHDRGALRHVLRGDQLGAGRDPLLPARERCARGAELDRAPASRSPACTLGSSGARRRPWFNGERSAGATERLPYVAPPRGSASHRPPARGSPPGSSGCAQRPSVAARSARRRRRWRRSSRSARSSNRGVRARVPRPPPRMDDAQRRPRHRARRHEEKEHTLRGGDSLRVAGAPPTLVLRSPDAPCGARAARLFARAPHRRRLRRGPHRRGRGVLRPSRSRLPFGRRAAQPRGTR